MTEFLTQWHTHFMNPDRIPTIIFAMLLCMIIGMITGPITGNANPFTWIVFDKLFGRLGDRLNRAHRKKADRMMRGFFLSIFVIIFAALIGKLMALATLIEPAFGITKILMLSMLLATGTLWFILLRLYFAMDQKKMNEGAYYAIARSTRTNLAANDDFGITRTAIGFSAKSLDKALIAPALWYLIAGLPAAAIYSALAMLTWRFGKNGTSTGFAAIPMALERLMGFVPNILTAALITAATAITPTAKLHKGVAAWLGHKNRSPYEQGGFPLSALAWGLNISLGGATQDLNGNAIKGEWIGPKGATAQLEHPHLRRAIYINIIAQILFIAALLGIYLWSDIL